MTFHLNSSVRDRAEVCVAALALVCLTACGGGLVTSAAPELEAEQGFPPAPPAIPAPPPPIMGSAASALTRAPQNLTDRVFAQGSAQAENTERYPDVKANGVKLAAETPVSSFSADVDTASYGNLRRYLHEGALPPADAVRVEEMINYFDYGYAVPRDRAQPFQPTIAVYPTPWNRDTRILHIGIKGYDLPKAARPQANLVFLIDTSGSMAAPNKLPLLKRSFRLLVDQLAPDDRVSMVVYAGSAGTVLPPTPGSDKAAILAALDRLEAGGSTAGGEGIRQAYELAKASLRKSGVNRVILASDGDFNVGITDPHALEDFVARERASGVFLTVLGFGGGNYNDVTMQKLAQAGNGAAVYIDTLNEAQKVFVDQIAGTLFTIAKDVKLQVEFNPAHVAEYRLIGYETRLLDRADFNNDKVDAGDIGSGHAVTALYEITPVGSSAQLTDPLRYGAKAAGGETNGEIAFLKIRYKLPSGEASQLITRAVTVADVRPDFAQVPADLRFAAAVAGAGQLLRNDPYAKRLDYARLIGIANAAKGEDPFGYRAEFVQLLRLAQSAASLKVLDHRAVGAVQ